MTFEQATETIGNLREFFPGEEVAMSAQPDSEGNADWHVRMTFKRGIPLERVKDIHTAVAADTRLVMCEFDTSERGLDLHLR